MIVGFNSNVSFAASFEEVQHFFDGAKQEFLSWLKTAPFGLSGGWMVSDWEYFALQKGLYQGALASVGWSLLVGLVVIFISSHNIIVSLFASLTISAIIFSTVAFLVLLGWELNILESVTISIAVGLAVDFTAHYAIAYISTAFNCDRVRRVEIAIFRMAPAISLAAMTSLIAGAGMLPATVLIYHKFGVFLIITISSSWFLSTYFFLPLLSICGPQQCCVDNWFSARRDGNSTVINTSSYLPSSSERQEVVERTTAV